MPSYFYVEATTGRSVLVHTSTFIAKYDPSQDKLRVSFNPDRISRMAQAFGANKQDLGDAVSAEVLWDVPEVDAKIDLIRNLCYSNQYGAAKELIADLMIDVREDVVREAHVDFPLEEELDDEDFEDEDEGEPTS